MEKRGGRKCVCVCERERDREKQSDGVYYRTSLFVLI